MATTYNEQNNPNANYYTDLPASQGTPTPGYVPAGSTPTPSTGANAAGTPGTWNTNPTTGINEFSASGGTPSPYYSRYSPSAEEKYLSTFTAPESEEQIQARKTRDAQGLIDSINQTYDAKLKEQDIVNQERNRGTNAVNVLSGLSGSSDANVAVNRTNDVNSKENQAIIAEKGMQIQSVLSQIRNSAATEARSQRDEARMNAEQILGRRKAAQEEAVGNLTMLAQSGTTAEGLKTTDPEAYAHLAQQVGGETMLKSMLALNRPKEQILDKRLEGGKYIVSYQNPLTGAIRIETADLGLPPEYTKTVDAGDRILAIPDNWSGDPADLITINKGLTPAQAQPKGTGGGGAGTEPKPLKLTASQVDTLSSFDTTAQAATEALGLLSKGISTGPLAGRLLQGAKVLGMQDAEQLKLEQMLGKIKADFMKALSGAAVAEPEAKRLAQFLPSITDQESVIQSKLNTLISETHRAKSNLLNTLGGSENVPDAGGNAEYEAYLKSINQ